MEDERRNQLESWQKKRGYAFKDIELLDTALTHTSVVKGDGNGRLHNERLEFLGDAVLELSVSRYLYRHYPKLNEGVMTRVRALAVCENALFEAAREYGVGDILRLSHGEERTGGREKPSILSDALEAVIGAIYLDGGWEAADAFILRFAEKQIHQSVQNINTKDCKTQLQEWAQKERLGAVEYVILDEKGPAHKKEFTIEARIQGRACGCGTAGSKRAAGQIAAKAALESLQQNNNGTEEACV